LLIDKLDSNVNGVYASDSVTVKALWGTNNAFATGTKGANVLTLCKAVGVVIAAKDGNIIGKSNVFLEGRRNAVRTEETNLGNLSSDANLWYAKKYDPKVTISLKNGGGIRSAIGYVNSVGSNVILERTQANPLASKSAGDVSQLDVENSLRFNNSLVIVSVSAAGVKRLIEHGISASKPGLTPGQFPQVGGVSFSYDTTKASGNKIWSMVIIDSIGKPTDTLVKYGKLVGDTSRTYKMVTLNFLANPSFSGSSVGGDNYPFPSVVRKRVDLDTAIKSIGTSSFASIGREQDAFAEYMLAKHNTASKAYKERDTTVMGDTRIQLMNARPDAIFPKLSTFALLTPANNSRVVVKDADPTPITITWEKSTGATRYVWILDLQSGNFTTPLLTLQSNNNGKNNDLTLTSGAISSALAGLGVTSGDSVSLKWAVKAYQEKHDSLIAVLPFNIKFVRFKPTTNVETLTLAKTIKFYPNPVVDFMNLTNTTGKDLDFQITDLKGQLLFEGKVSEMAKIDMSHLASGLYMFNVRNEHDSLRYLFVKSN
jgi:hypothetical protein